MSDEFYVGMGIGVLVGYGLMFVVSYFYNRAFD